MKKKFLLIFCCFFIVFPCFSLQRSIGFLTGNDCFTFGLAYNNDDLKSYSFGFNFETDRYTIRTEALGFTGRLLDNRFDLIETSFTYNFNHWDSLDIKLTTGIVLYGFMNLDYFQNTLHKTINIKTVNLPYKKSDISLIPLAGANIKYSFLPFLDTYASLKARFGFDYQEEFGLSTSYDIFSFNIGYLFHQNAVSDNVLEKYISESAGILYGFTIDKGQLLLEFKSRAVTRNGFTTVTISPLSPLKQSAIELSVNRISMSNFRYAFFSNEFSYKNLLLCLRNHSDMNEGTNKNQLNRSDSWVYGAGYEYDWKFFNDYLILQPRVLALYIADWYRVPEENSSYYSNTFSKSFGINLELKCGLSLGDYTLNLLGGGYWIYEKGFGYLYGVGITL